MLGVAFYPQSYIIMIHIIIIIISGPESVPSTLTEAKVVYNFVGIIMIICICGHSIVEWNAEHLMVVVWHKQLD